MQFIVLGYDGADENAPERRLAARESHLKLGKELFDRGLWLYAAAMLRDDGRMIGSMIVCEFASREELETEWLKKEPYILGNVWKKIEVSRAQTAPFFKRA